MKRWLTLLFFLGHFWGMAHADVAEGDARMRARHNLVVRATAARLLDLVHEQVDESSPDADRWIAPLAAHMLASPAEHIHREQSRERSRDYLAKRRHAALEAQVAEMLEEAERQSPFAIPPQVLFERAELPGPEVLREVSRRFGSQILTQVFPAAREQAVARQLDVVRRNLGRPPQAELDARLEVLPKQSENTYPSVDELDALLEWLAGVVASEGTPLFEETRLAADELAAGMLARIREEYRVQIEALKEHAVVTALPENAIFADQIAWCLASGMQEAVVAAWAQSDVVPYELFAVVHTGIQDASQRLEEARVRQFLGDWVGHHITPQRMAALILADPRAHKAAGASRDHLIDTFVAADWERVAADYLAGVGESVDKDRVQARLAGAEMPLLLREVIGRHVDALQQAVRTDVAMEQSAAIRAALLDLDALDGALVQELWQQVPKQSVASRVQALQALQVLGVPVEEKGNLWIEEAEALVVAAVGESVAPAFTAQREQLAMGSAIEQARREELAQDVKAGIGLDAMREKWHQDFLARWAAGTTQSVELYPDMLPLTKTELEKALRQYYDSVQTAVALLQKEAEDVDQQEDTSSDTIDPQEPVEPTDEETPEEEPEEDQQTAGVQEESVVYALLAGVDVLLYFLPETEDRQVMVATSLGTWQSSIQQDAGPAALAEVFTLLQPALEGVLERAEEQQVRGRLLGVFPRQPRPVKLTIAVLVGSREVRHMTSLLLRQEVEHYLEAWADARAQLPVDMKWQDGLVPAVGTAPEP